MKTQKNNN